MEGKIIEISISKIMPHPNNPRKNLGDVTELAESIKQNGILQNLTVIPVSALTEVPDNQPEADSLSGSDEFYVLIGHRRRAASILAGLEKVPCTIRSKISQSEQVSIMLQENGQRNDLTIYEQANGFQMMLDFGETEESIAEKTGFSRTTVRRRLNIAKLDQDVLQQKEKDESFQLTLTGIYALEQIEDVNVRNKILSDAENSSNLVWRVKQELERIQKEKNVAEIIKLLKAAGVAEAPEEYESTQYSNKWAYVDTIYGGKEPKEIDVKKYQGCFYVVSYSNIYIRKKAVKTKAVKSEYELEREQIDRNKRKIKSLVKAADEERALFVREMIKDNLMPKNVLSDISKMWKLYLELDGYAYVRRLCLFLLDSKEEWYKLTDEEREKGKLLLKNTAVYHQMLITLQSNTEGKELTDYNGRYRKDNAEQCIAFAEYLSKFGFSYSKDEYYEVMEGTHKCYALETALKKAA